LNMEGEEDSGEKGKQQKKKKLKNRWLEKRK
jgi:hypothetical protein